MARYVMFHGRRGRVHGAIQSLVTLDIFLVEQPDKVRSCGNALYNSFRYRYLFSVNVEGRFGLLINIRTATAVVNCTHTYQMITTIGEVKTGY
jgi:hypothetical protein